MVVAILQITFVLTLSVSAQQNLLAVLDLASDGSIPGKNLSLISDKISEVVAADGTYMLFTRNTLPELLKQFSIYESAAACSDQQCLVVTGSLIGANTMIGGSIKYEKNLTEITLNMVDVAGKQTINSVTMSTGSKKADFLKIEIPALVQSLLNPGKVSPQPKLAAKKNFFTNPFLYAGTLLVGGAAAGAYYFKFYRHDDEGDGEPEIEEKDLPLSMDDIPVRTRGPGQ